jgi:repressor LexA
MQLVNNIQPLSPKEKLVLEFISEFIKREGVSPTFKEIQANFGFSSINSVQNYIKQLEEKKYIKNPGDNQKRALKVLRSSNLFRDSVREIKPNPVNEAISIPLLGKVAAGSPIEHLKYDEFIEIPASLVKNVSLTYALQIQGDSMIEDGIFNGDTILVQRQSYASDGEIIVAVVNNEATVKRIYRKLKNGKPLVELRPSNSDLNSFWYSPEKVDIRGIVVGLIRKYM